MEYVKYTYIFHRREKIFKEKDFDFCGFLVRGSIWKFGLHCGIYKDIQCRWVKIVFDL